jgi:hypothetical protein
MVTELREIPDLELAREEMRPPEFRHETALLGASLRR